MNGWIVYAHSAAEEGRTIAEQVEQIQKYCRENGLQVAGEPVTEIGVPGQRDEMIERILADPQLDGVVVWKYNRLSRNVTEYMQIINRLHKAGKHVVSVVDEIDEWFAETILEEIGSWKRMRRIK